MKSTYNAVKQLCRLYYTYKRLWQGYLIGDFVSSREEETSTLTVGQGSLL